MSLNESFTTLYSLRERYPEYVTKVVHDSTLSILRFFEEYSLLSHSSPSTSEVNTNKVSIKCPFHLDTDSEEIEMRVFARVSVEDAPKRLSGIISISDDEISIFFKRKIEDFEHSEIEEVKNTITKYLKEL